MSKKLNKNQTINVGLVSLGCPKNTVDSETMLGKLAQSGYCIVGDITLADAVIVNTCGFIEPAKQEAIEQLKEVATYKDTGRLKCVIAAGCLAQRMGEELLALVPQIDAIVGLGARDDIVRVVDNAVESFQKRSYLPKDNDFVASDCGRLLTTLPHYAYLRISEGCDRNCAFCTIPSIRGKFRSKPLADIEKEAKELAASGVREVVIIAQDSSYYGKDLKIKNGLVKLLDMLEALSFDWIRVMYLYPATVTDELIAKFASSKKVLPYIDIPIQHIDDEILKSMHRADTAKSTADLIEKLRRDIAGVILRTTVITGYPQETEQQHKRLLDFIKRVKFDALGCFTYFAEAGTVAAKLDGQVDAATQNRRLDEIMTAQQAIVFAKNKAAKGKIFDVIIDQTFPDGTAQGRYYGQAPEIDGVCLFRKCRANAGDIIKAKITAYQDYDLIVKQIGS